MLALGCTYIFLQFTQRLKAGILNVALSWIDERDKKLEFSRLGPFWVIDSLVDQSMLFPQLYLMQG